MILHLKLPKTRSFHSLIHEISFGHFWSYNLSALNPEAGSLKIKDRPLSQNQNSGHLGLFCKVTRRPKTIMINVFRLLSLSLKLKCYIIKSLETDLFIFQFLVLTLRSVLNFLRSGLWSLVLLNVHWWMIFRQKEGPSQFPLFLRPQEDCLDWNCQAPKISFW